MHGHIHLCLKDLVLEKFGEEAWASILELAGSNDSEDFLQFELYPDSLTERLIEATITVSGIARPQLLEIYGVYFFHYAVRRGYGKMLNTLGDDYVSFLKRLDFLHSLLATTYEGMVPPRFRCEEKDGKVLLHFYSKRGRGMCNLALGLAREVGIQMFNVDVQATLLSIEELFDHPEGYKEYAVIDMVITDPQKDTSVVSQSDHGSTTGEIDESNQMDVTGSELVLAKSSVRRALPYYLEFDVNMTVCGCGKALEKFYPKLSSRHSGRNLNDHFHIVEPNIELTYDQILRNLHAAFILKLKQDNASTQVLTLKGSMVKTENSSHFTFLCSPYFYTLRDLTDNSITLTNFPTDDVIRELFFMNEQRKTEVMISKKLDSTTIRLRKISEALEVEKKRTDELLHRMLPPKVAKQLQAGKRVEAEKYEQATVLFSDIVTFTSMASSCEPIQVVTVLNELFQQFDELTSKHDVYKVETIGDAYMVVSGVPEVISDHAQRTANMGLDMVVAAKRVSNPVTHTPIQIRVGIHSGPVVSGVVGQKMPRYCLFGDTVNTASRMESHGIPDRVHLSEATYLHIKDTELSFEARGLINIKGKGKMFTYFLLGNDTRLFNDTVLDKVPVILNGSQKTKPKFTRSSADAKSQTCEIL